MSELFNVIHTPGDPYVIAQFEGLDYFGVDHDMRVKEYSWSCNPNTVFKGLHDLLTRHRILTGIGYIATGYNDEEPEIARLEPTPNIVQESDNGLTSVSCRFNSGVSLLVHRAADQGWASASTVLFARNFNYAQPGLKEMVDATATFPIRRHLETVIAELEPLASQSVGANRGGHLRLLPDDTSE